MSMIIPELTELVPADHEYRKLLNLVDFEALTRPLEKLYSRTGRSGYPVTTGFKALLLQFMLDLSDRQMEKYLSENLAGKYFCGFGLMEQTPDHTYFCKFRERIGTKELAKLFNTVRDGLKQKGYIREVYTFVDAASLNAKVDTWKARDKAIEDSRNRERNDADEPTMNNRNAEDYSTDPNARFGCKGKNNIWRNRVPKYRSSDTDQKLPVLLCAAHRTELETVLPSDIQTRRGIGRAADTAGFLPHGAGGILRALWSFNSDSIFL